MLSPTVLRTAGRVHAKQTVSRSQLHSFTSSAQRLKQQNRVFDPIRATDEFDSARLLRSPFITLWTASWCSTCKTVQPLIRELIEKQGAGASDSASVGYAEVELDAPTIADVAMRYQLTSVPTLLSFRMGEPHMDTRVTDAAKLADKAFLIKWIEEEARNGGSMGNKGKSLFGGFFGA